MNFPSKCPYCGKDNVENLINSVSELSEEPQYIVGNPCFAQHGLTLGLHRCIHCGKPIFVLNEETTDGAGNIIVSNVIHYYPTVTTVDFPKRIKELSPNAYKTYEQTIKAKEQGYDMLVGAGLRIALEWLVTDYLIKVKELNQSEIEKLKLFERIKEMSCDFYTEVCTRLIRLYGNDTVHTMKKLDFLDDEVIEMFELLCSLIDSELQIKEVNSRLPKKS